MRKANHKQKLTKPVPVCDYLLGSFAFPAEVPKNTADLVAVAYVCTKSRNDWPASVEDPINFHSVNEAGKSILQNSR